MKKLIVFLALLVKGFILAQVIFTDLGEVRDSSEHTLSLSKGSVWVLFSCSDDSEVSATIGLKPAQVNQLQAYLAKAYANRKMGSGKSAGFGPIRSQNSDISVLIVENRVALCVTEGRLDRFFQIDGKNYNKTMALLSQASGARFPVVTEPVQPRQPRQPGIDHPSYPTHP